MTSRELVQHQKYSSQLHRMLMSFDTSELRTLCFDLDVDYDNLPGEGKMDKARELVMYLRRHQRPLNSLKQAVNCGPILLGEAFLSIASHKPLCLVARAIAVPATTCVVFFGSYQFHSVESH